ncbi:zinc finger CCCH domain-containing protein 7A isoform X2 [Chiloscyllium plagiosum]|uniref:zinc finger CCCH domain-containing protein 7A isoform X1 n=1 Tax=Chiloscyllium plagiosum TaxID=36176 RepID=UPI001CB7C88F|nr:zinc finger CCCH domain-containing protein 7A isoform X1 [Chiloscyllium plagiosum]XP_043567914.1 zinc finger CCCH domain-containing protein 7A isoform X2 [Chiloscyllium plagiosum]
MSNVSKDRSNRWQETQKGLQFIQSTLPYPGTEREYEVFLQDLVRNLNDEGNDKFRECNWADALNQYTEALNVAHYASEEVSIVNGVIEKLYANRAACYLNMGLYNRVLDDCDKALQLNDRNYRALYRKAKSLKELGRHEEAYKVVAECSLAVPQDDLVIKLTQELAQKLGLKIRKAYVRTQPPLTPVVAVSSLPSAESSNQPTSGLDSVEDIEIDFPAVSSEPSVSSSVSLDDISQTLCDSASIPVISNSASPTPKLSKKTSLCNTALVNGEEVPFSVPESRLEFSDGDKIGDDLDELLDSMSTVEDTQMKPMNLKGSISSSLPAKMPSSIPCPSSVLVPPPQVISNSIPSVTLPSVYSLSMNMLPYDTFGSRMDSLDSLPIMESQRAKPPGLGVGAGIQGHNSTSSYLPLNSTTSLFSSNRNIGVIGQNGSGLSRGSEMGANELSTQTLGRNPLSDTHEFKQACPSCFKIDSKGLTYTYNRDVEHKCTKDILIGRLKNPDGRPWKKIRPRPTKNQYVGPYYICKDVAAGEECRYPGHCTFAYCQEEIDVWTLERKGAFNRELLFDPFGSIRKVNLTVAKILQEHHGIFMFLCEKCFDNKPRMIHKNNKDNQAYCSNPDAKHLFEQNKCLVHILRETMVKCSKIRSFDNTRLLDLCRHEVRFGCNREDECFYAHSLIELKVWMMQHDTHISHEAIAQESKKYWQNLEASTQSGQVPLSMTKSRNLNLKLKFVCGQCWRHGQVSEPDKNRKYCNAKARHPWTKERRVLLVMSNERKKWTTIRPLPSKKPIPQQFDLCLHIAKGKKCTYTGLCSFAHSLEEKDMWTYMKDSNILDMEQLYEMWLKSQEPEKEEVVNAPKENGKQIHMPTDYADLVIGYHCWLCGKSCNSEKQWQQHITSEKHKEKVFSCEDDQNCWQHRFPTGQFSVCQMHETGNCPEEENCQFAHSKAELQEWMDRREVLRQKLAKAKKDHLIAPDDDDFGKFDFLIKDLN